MLSNASQFQGQLDIETQCRGFLDLAKLAGGKLVQIMFKEQAFLDLFQRLYHSEEWVDRSTTSSILATLKDYFQDYEAAIDASNFKRHELWMDESLSITQCKLPNSVSSSCMCRLVERCLEETVARFIAAFLTHIKTITEEVLVHIQQDIDAISKAFEAHLKPDKVRGCSRSLCSPNHLSAICHTTHTFAGTGSRIQTTWASGAGQKGCAWPGGRQRAGCLG